MKLGFIEKIGSIGAFLAAATCPACFPLLAVVGAALGLSVFQPFEGAVFLVFKIFVLLALIGNILSYFKHRNLAALIVGILSPLLIFFAIYLYFNPVLIYAGLFGLLGASILNFLANRRCSTCKPKEVKT
jgi:mercuric ion transport protein